MVVRYRKRTNFQKIDDVGQFVGFPYTGCLLYWKLNGNSNDSTANGFNGTDTSITYEAGKIGDCAKMNATTDKIQNTGVTGSPTGTNASTFALWIYNEETTVADYRDIIRYGTRSSNAMRCITSINGTYVLSQYGTSSTSLGAVKNNEREHIAVVYNGTKFLTYRNGTKIAYEWTYTVNTSGTTFTIGNDGYACAKGKYDEVGFWNRALTQDEITKLYNGGDGLTY